MTNRGKDERDGIAPNDDSDSEETILSNYLKERSAMPEASDVSKMRVLEQQVVDLRHQVRELKSQNKYLSDLHKVPNESRPAVVVARKHSARSSSDYSDTEQVSSNMSEITFTLDKLSVQPKLSRTVIVKDQAGALCRSPNSEELERIVVHLYRTNEQLQNEMEKLKGDLKEVLYSHKWTPEAYLLAKAYVSKDRTVPTSAHSLPKLPMQNAPRKLPDLAYISRDTVTLPALKNTMGTKAAERRKRTQILQKARLHKEVL